ncbi:hypothetical protein ACIGZJ_35990 [Kitasatospora sp. NPDC052868]|uniref:hypothetical protein n=1 Tax=Kitasatospora sp. NPDC052868 TaxID=3364060 RepID=UPI0037CAADB2
MAQRRSRSDLPWAELVADQGLRLRYEAKVHRRGTDACHFWIGAISSSGHGKLKTSKVEGRPTLTITAHVLGWAIEYGAESVATVEVIRHSCDSPSCNNPRHWLAGTRRDNVLDYASRSRIAGHALDDERGAAGRASAIRAAILAAQASGEDVDAAIERAIIAGQPGGAWQDPLF